MPMLWGDGVTGWVNASVKDGKFEAEPGFIAKRPTGRAFKLAFEEEVESLARFLERG